MSPYGLEVANAARDAVNALPAKDRSVVLDAIRIILTVPYREGTKLKDDLSGYRRLKKGRYRVFYRVIEDRKLIEILFVGFRKEGDKQDAYRLFRKLIGR